MSAATPVTVSVLDAACWYARHGLHVVPVELRGKKPAIDNWQNAGSTDLPTLNKWFARNDRNIGIVCGLSSVAVVDVDPRNRGDVSFDELSARLGPLPATVTADTGGGGQHYLFRAPASTANLMTKIADGIELLHGGRQILAMPSVHPSGGVYRWRTGLAPGDIGLAELPATWLAHATRKPAAAALPQRTEPRRDALRRASAYLARMEPSISGQGGHNALWEATCRMMHGFELDDGDVRSLLVSEFNPRCDPPWSEREIEHKIREARERAEADKWRVESRSQTTWTSTRTEDDDEEPHEDVPHAFRLTEIGNAQRFAAMHGDRLRYVQSWGRWLICDGQRWRRDETGSEVVAAKEVVSALYAEASALAQAAATGDEGAGQRAEMLAKWARTSSRASSLRAMTALAQSEAPIAATGDAFDRDRFLLNVENGTLDLRTGDLRPHRQQDMLTMLAPVKYQADARCPLWDAFLARVLPDAEVRTWLQRYVGYALSGDVGEQILAFMLGAGANGKSVLLDVLLAILGDYGLRAAPELVLARHGEVHPTELADLEGKRLVVCSEIEQGRAWAEGTIKRITGDTTITARRMRQDFYTFPATHKIAIAANTRPTVRGTDHAIWRRMRLVPFGVTIPPAERDKGLVAKLLAEAPGILAWAVRGCLDWQRHGLGAPAAIAAATEDYRAEQDVLGHWIAEECVLLAGAFTPMSGLYESYVAWCAATGREAWTRDTVRARLLERPGLTDDRTKVARGIRGIGLRANKHLEAVG